jgi:hypothetical protein
MDLRRTYEILTKKVSVIKVAKGKNRTQEIVGYEYEIPTAGEPYSVFVNGGKVFKTSSVQEIKETYNGVLIKTKNSIYRIQYLR